MTIDCSVIGAAGCEQLKAIAIMLDEGRTVGPSNMYGNPTAILAIVLATTLAAFLLLTGLVITARKLYNRNKSSSNYGMYDDDASDKTFVGSKLFAKPEKSRKVKDEEVLFRLSMSPY
ncbi:hypothetical protein IWW36_004672 [Coemansia brasiliensis]|uniref:Uncharacterized protein n=1 Tax=Coemansia brasiliensis TaxID=2650707 RepID=A0A9W8I9A2_9FUNG|nr:hypothetical protein IWW36_004672 [Coemansia brasiliensis]